MPLNFFPRNAVINYNSVVVAFDINNGATANSDPTVIHKLPHITPSQPNVMKARMAKLIPRSGVPCVG
jgi:hypothetical protein